MSIKIKKQQILVLSLIVGSLIVILALLAYWGNSSTVSKQVNKPDLKKYNLASPLSAASSEAHWIEKTQNAWRAEQQKSLQVDKHLQTLGEEKDKQQKLIATHKEELAELKAMVVALHEEVTHLKTDNEATAHIAVNQNNNLLPRASEESQAAMVMDTGFINYSAKLNKVTQPRIKTPDNYVFSNTFAKAVVLQGADASAGVLSQANPDVMMFQIIDDGVMPNKHKSHLNGCFFSASVVGDISSERGKFRTERLSCIHPDGTNIDTQVTGIVSDSKNGIRGRPVWRDGPMVRKAFWGNFWESMGGIGKHYSTDYSTSPLGSVATVQAAKIPLAAVSSGGEGAAKMYAQYTIKRAELYHPVIELPPGSIVDVTFLKGFWLDGGTDTSEPEQSYQSPKTLEVSSEAQQSPEEQAAKQFFYKNHSF